MALREVVNIETIIKNVEEHKKAIIYRFFGNIEDLEIDHIDISDSENMHVVISFFQGEKILYRDSAMDLEQCFIRYLSWFNNTIIKNTPLYCRNILSYSDCSFIESIDENTIENIRDKRRFYYKLGCVIAILSSLNVDIIDENDIIKMEESPVVKDVEGLIQSNPSFAMNRVKGKELLEEMKKHCPSKYQLDMDEGYQIIYQYIRENEDNMWSLINVCFQ